MWKESLRFNIKIMNSKKILIPLSLGLIGLFVFNSCKAKIPAGAEPVRNFDKERYLGKWYEIARLDFTWEKNLNNVTAEYGTKDNGNISVLNRGYDYKKDKWKESEGEAKPVGDAYGGQS